MASTPTTDVFDKGPQPAGSATHWRFPGQTRKAWWQAEAARQNRPFSKVVAAAQALGTLEFIDQCGETYWVMPEHVLAGFEADDLDAGYVPVLRRVVLDPRKAN